MKIQESSPKIHPSISSAAKKLLSSRRTSTAKTEFSDSLKKLGWGKIGYGKYSDIYSNSSKPFIIKINSQPDAGFAAYVSLIRKNPNPHFPKISDLKKISVNGKLYNIYLMEKLQPIPSSKAWRMTNWLEDYLSHDNLNDSLEEIFRYRPGGVPKMFKDKVLVKALEVLRNYADKHRILIDMHEGNIMQRKNGTIVVTDPYVM